MSRIKNIKRKRIKDETLWNLAVKEDESFIANGIVVHNCRSTLIPITIYEEFKPDEKVGKTNINEFIDENKGKGFAKN